MRLGVSWVMIVVGAACVAALETEAERTAKKMEQDSIPGLAPDQYQQRVTAAGGRVDFVFEDDRPFKECHASTVVETSRGSLLCAWFGGAEEKDPDVGIWMAECAKGEWSKPRTVAKIRQTAHWNPVLFGDPKRGIYLFFKVGGDVPHWRTYWTWSDDCGTTWSSPEELVAGDTGGRGPVKNKPIILSDGAWLAPASTELGAWKPFADRSEDGGKSWTRSADWAIDKADIRGQGGIQPTFWESAPGKVHALMRTTGGCIARTDSEDGGRTWGPVYKTGLPNNNSGIDCLRLEDGRVLLVYNPIALNWGPRSPLTLAVSKDNGKTWTNIAHLENEKAEFSYPAIVRTANGVAISYTWKRERIRCWQVPLSALE